LSSKRIGLIFLNGKNRPIDRFLHTETVIPNISEKDEYLLYRKALKERILSREELKGLDVKHILQAREQGIKLLRSKVSTLCYRLVAER
jgi:hypothetical protein